MLVPQPKAVMVNFLCMAVMDASVNMRLTVVIRFLNRGNL